MKALVPTGQSRALVSLADTGVPEPQPGEALVKVEAFSVNRGEIFQLEDRRPGTRPGKDIAGLVVQAAADGTGPAVGQRVAGHPEAGGWAEYAAVPTTALAPLPDSVPAVQAAALPLAGLTALRLLRSAGSVAGRRILLTGASGGPQTVTIRSFAYWDSPVPYGRDLAVLLRLVATGRLHPEIGRLAGWEDAAATLADLYERRIRGNAVLTIQ